MKRRIIAAALISLFALSCSSPMEPEPLQYGNSGLLTYGHIYPPENIKELPEGHVGWWCFTCGGEAFRKVKLLGAIPVGNGKIDSKANYRVYNSLGPSNHEEHAMVCSIRVNYGSKNYMKKILIKKFPRPPLKCDFHITEGDIWPPR